MNMVACISSLLALLLMQSAVPRQNGTAPLEEANRAFPAVHIAQPDGTDALLYMDKLSIDIRIVGNFAVTTMDMRFANELDRVLEGELLFPLGDGQTVSRFAMDVEGRLREGVVVEKAKGRQVFEDITRTTVDPGLLELTRGNMFRSRVYPIPARGTKRIVVAYEQELIHTEGGLLYTLPMQFPHAIDSFSFRAEVVNSSTPPDLSRSEFTDAVFDQWHHSYRAEYSAVDVRANRQFTLLVPGAGETRVVVEDDNDETFFTVALSPPLHAGTCVFPRSLCLLWDASGSGAMRDIAREYAVLDSFFAAVGSCTVELAAFSSSVDSIGTFRIAQGNWQALRRVLDSIPFDGGTQLGALELGRYRCDGILLVSDGISNFGESAPATGTTPVLVLNSSQAAEHSVLRSLALRTGGRYINLPDLTNTEAVQAMLTRPYGFISATYSDGDVADIYPSIPTPLRGRGFTLAGKLRTPQATLTLHFGVGDRILATETVVISKAQSAAVTGVTPRIWAQKKLAELDLDYRNNKEALLALGREYSIVTRGTSLLVLDRLADYVRYRIVPPDTEPELRKAYVAAVEQEQQNIADQRRQHIDHVAAMFQAHRTWWEQEFPDAEHIAKKNKAGQAQREEAARRTQDRATTNTDEEPLSETEAYEGSLSETETLSGSLSVQATEPDNDNADPLMPAPAPHSTAARGSSRGSGFNIRGGRTSETTMRVDGLELSDMAADDERAASPAPEGTARSSSIALAPWNPQTPYMDALKRASADELYTVYTEQKRQYGNSPGFFLDVASLFAERGRTAEALRILSNIAELHPEDHQLLRILGTRLLQIGYNRLAVAVFTDVLAMREEEPQSYRDLGLALAADRQYQRAVDTLYALVQRPWHGRFPEVELIALTEMNRIIDEAGEAVTTSHIDPRLRASMPVDIRVVLSWDADNCDIDLWVIEPTGERCYYQNRSTRIGGAMSHDLTGGYGPEQYLIRKASNGTYTIRANYYGDRQQRLTGPTTIQVSLFTNYGRSTERRKDITLRMSSIKQIIDIGALEFSAAEDIQAVGE